METSHGGFIKINLPAWVIFGEKANSYPVAFANSECFVQVKFAGNAFYQYRSHRPITRGFFRNCALVTLEITTDEFEVTFQFPTHF